MRIALHIPAADRFPLSASEFPGTGDRVLLVAPATGVKRRLYDHLAAYFATQGITTVTWDWRGTGESRPANLRGFPATMREWATLDLRGVIDWSVDRYAGARLYVLGHSFGGQAVGLAPNAGELSGFISVAAQHGYYGHWPRMLRYRYALLWHVVMPAITHTLGYFPGQRLGFGEDLPKSVALQWAQWCRRPAGLGEWEGHARFSAPLLALTFTDDDYAPPAAANALLAQYGSPEREHRLIHPRDAGVTRIGHFGFFREGLLPDLWRATLEWVCRH